ncbi:MAG: S8 family serine peptidase [Candidatus Promineifilaceae bacterium]|nr:S8 family serine peptidase [Candidatus Promineifilaceae bacterium]
MRGNTARRVARRPPHSHFLLALSLLMLVFLSGALLLRPAASASSWTEKVDSSVVAAAVEGKQVEFLLVLHEQAELDAASDYTTKHERAAYVVRELMAVAERSQRPLLAMLKAAGAEATPFWVVNMIKVRGDAALVEAVARRPDVARLHGNPWMRVLEPPADPLPSENLPPAPEAPSADALAPAAVEWNVSQVRAPEVWAAGVTGEGIVVGGQDTGYEWEHPALKQQYRGWNGIAADHNYNWHDAIHENRGSNRCGIDVLYPCDDYSTSHGTHTMGTIVGDDGGNNHIGVAPGARWIGCRNMDNGYGTPETYIECFQWFLAPTDLQGQNADPTRAPHIINNSWGCPESEGCPDDLLQTTVDNVRAAGILVVASAGNAGSACGTVEHPAAIYDSAFSIGATYADGTIASFSSRGPVTVDGSMRLKPDVVAPGVAIRSSVRDGYGSSNGTSMAAPHVAGLAALLLSAEPRLIGQVDLVEEIIRESAVPLTTSENCGGIPGSEVPNNTYGYGGVDALAAYELVAELFTHRLALRKAATPAMIGAGDLLTYTLRLTHTHALSSAHAVVLTDTIPLSTTLVASSDAYTVTNGVVSWSRPALDPRETWTVQMVVRVDAPLDPLALPPTIENSAYGAHAAEATAPAAPPVETPTTVVAVALEPDHTTSVRNCSPASYTHTLTNTGSITTTFNLTSTSTAGWTTLLSPVATTLGPGASQTVTATLLLPCPSWTSVTDITTITAIAEGDRAAADSAMNTTQLQRWHTLLPVLKRP